LAQHHGKQLFAAEAVQVERGIHPPSLSHRLTSEQIRHIAPD
jgi:hypothetical protein